MIKIYIKKTYCLFKKKYTPTKIHPGLPNTTNWKQQITTNIYGNNKTNTNQHKLIKTHTYTQLDITSYGHDELVEFAHPHDFTGFAPEHLPPQYLPSYPVPDLGYDTQHFADVHEPHAHYGPPLSPYSQLTNYIGTERKGK